MRLVLMIIRTRAMKACAVVLCTAMCAWQMHGDRTSRALTEAEMATIYAGAEGTGCKEVSNSACSTSGEPGTCWSGTTPDPDACALEVVDKHSGNATYSCANESNTKAEAYQPVDCYKPGAWDALGGDFGRKCNNNNCDETGPAEVACGLCVLKEGSGAWVTVQSCACGDP